MRPRLPAAGRSLARLPIGVVGEVAVGVVGPGLDPGGEVLVQRVGRVDLAAVARGSRI